MQIICFLLMLAYAAASVDLFTTASENKKLFGVAAEIFYIRNVEVNSISASYAVHVRSNISALQFWWISKDVSSPAKYSMNVKYDPTAAGALGKWSSNISAMGEIPNSLQSFVISIPCVGKSDSVTDVFIELNITVVSRDKGEVVTRVSLPRKRFCSIRPEVEVVSSVEEPVLNVSRLTEEDKYFGSVPYPASTATPNGSVYITAIIVGLLFVVFATCIGLIICKSRPKPVSDGTDCEYGTDEHASPPLLADIQMRDVNETPYSPPPRSYPPIGAQFYDDAYSLRSAFVKQHAPSVVDPVPRSQPDFERYLPIIKQLDISSDYVEVGEVLVNGTFGVVRRGILKLPEQEERNVMVKTVKPGTTGIQMKLMLMEGLLLDGIEHPNIQELLACVSQAELPMVIFAGSEQVNLKMFILNPINAKKLGIPYLVKFGVDVINGLEFLHQNNLVHKDIATRNCLISPSLKVEISDNALARDFFPDEYQCLGDNENRPVKWMAHESLVQGIFHPPSDIWSCGVLLWELLSYGLIPYLEIDAFEMDMVLREGFRPLKPPSCPDDLYHLITSCWHLPAESRPIAEDLLRDVTAFYNNLTNYV